MEGPRGKVASRNQEMAGAHGRKNCYGVGGRHRKNERDGDFRMTAEG